MGVSYWRIGQRERAHKLTKAGVELVQQGIAEGLLGPESLEVPQSNLASMSRALGIPAETSPVQQATSSTGPTRLAARPQQIRSGRQATSPAAGNRQPTERTTRGTIRR
jgi:hypothetical protein